MKKIKISIGNKEYNVELAISNKEQEQGLQNIKSLSADEGMLFVFDKPDEISFWMKNTSIPLDIIFINEEMNVISVHKGVPFSEELITEDNVSFVLEVNENSGIKKEDELEILSNKKIKLDKMHVLDTNGQSQMDLEGGERIFSRNHTKTLIKFAKKADVMDNDNGYRALGKRIFKFLQVQNDTPEEYVQSKN